MQVSDARPDIRLAVELDIDFSDGTRFDPSVSSLASPPAAAASERTARLYEGPRALILSQVRTRLFLRLLIEVPRRSTLPIVAIVGREPLGGRVSKVARQSAL
jgi:hypothetical protein